LEERHSLTFFLTGLDGSKPLMQWHTTENLVSSYVYTDPKPVAQHNLRSKEWNEIKAIIPPPWLWDIPDVANALSGRDGPPPATGSAEEGKLLSKHYQTKNGLSYFLLLDGIEDKQTKHLCLFPAWMKSELHGVRKVIERYSNEEEKESMESNRAAGKQGYVGGVELWRGHMKPVLVRTEGKENGEIGLWEVDCFEDGMRRRPVVSQGTQMDDIVDTLNQAE
jgi:hypothetical protein